MFDNLVESTSNAEKNARTGAFFAVTASIWLVLLVSIIVAGIFWYDAKLSADFEKESMLVAAAPPPPPPPPPPPSSTPKQVVVTNIAPPMTAVAKPPEKINPPVPKPTTTNVSAGTGVVGGVPGGVPGGVEGGDPDAIGLGGSGPPPPPPPPAPTPPPDPPKPSGPQRVSGGVLAGKATNRVQPPYPPMAKQANIEGSVVVEVTVSESGSVIGAKAVSGHPLLRPAAEQAARGWRFSPTLLSGVPVKVIGTITFNFRKS
jgi:periplasmic protein TonB